MARNRKTPGLRRASPSVVTPYSAREVAFLRGVPTDDFVPQFSDGWGMECGCCGGDCLGNADDIKVTVTGFSRGSDTLDELLQQQAQQASKILTDIHARKKYASRLGASAGWPHWLDVMLIGAMLPAVIVLWYAMICYVVNWVC